MPTLIRTNGETYDITDEVVVNKLLAIGFRIDGDPSDDMHDVTVQPAQADNKAMWAAHAEHLGIVVDGLTKAQIIDAVLTVEDEDADEAVLEDLSLEAIADEDSDE